MKEKILHQAATVPAVGAALYARIESDVSVEIKGTFSNLAGRFQVSMDGTTWHNISGIKMDGLTQVETVTTAGAYETSIGGWKHFRFNISAITGSVTVFAVATGVAK